MSVWTTRVQMDTGDMKILSDVYMYGYVCICPGKAPGSELTQGKRGSVVGYKHRGQWGTGLCDSFVSNDRCLYFK